jgi:hypothetical protein
MDTVTTLPTFRIHTGEEVSGPRLSEAFRKAGDAMENLALEIRAEDPYAPHVTEAEKDAILADDLALAQRIRDGEVKSFAVWQRVNMELTGECVALLGKAAR